MNENQERETATLATIAEAMQTTIDAVGTVGEELADLVKTQKSLVDALATQGRELEEARSQRYAFARVAVHEKQRADGWRVASILQLAVAVAAFFVEVLR
jgi:uncharacterized protein YoxC